ncbi:hypothetical protein MLD38_010146 [Melastoma candidum]|uniref:Uncharacterized protein n=1 Tax=Melastoma candidum TaxID=119954 RepID=A0ACB9R0Q6_9MYRT|nr:hypothetical protein MLD38_010146 [Melastoma candidum]
MKSLLRPSKNITKFAYFLSPDPSPFTSLGTFLGNGPLRLPSSDFAFLRSFSGQRRELSCFLSSPSWRTTLFPVCLSGRGGGNVNGVTGSSFSSGICVPAPRESRLSLVSCRRCLVIYRYFLHNARFQFF